MISRTFFLTLVGIITFGTIHADGGDWLILDGTRNFSYAMARVLIENQIPCTLVVKPSDMMHYDMRFDDKSLITLVQLDYSKESCREQLAETAKGKKFLYLDPEHGEFLDWHDTLPRIATNALIAARTHKLQVFYAGRVYPLDKSSPITKDSKYSPSDKLTEQGKTLIKIEKMIKFMTDNGFCKVCTIRTGHPFGPGMYDYLLSSSFKDIPKNGMFTWLYTIKHKYQFCYTHDAARLALHLSDRTLDTYECVPFGGYFANPEDCLTVSDFADRIVKNAQGIFRSSNKMKHRTVNRSRLNLVSKFEPNALRGIDLADFFRNPAIIDGRETEQRFNFSPTDIDQAMKETLLWYATCKDTKGLFVLRDEDI